MTTTRDYPPLQSDERTMLESWLDFHRATLALKCEGLDDARLRERSAPPSTLSLLGLVRHLAEVERAWFRRVLAGEDVPRIHGEGKRDGDFDLTEEATGEEAFATWHAEVALAREIAARHSLDDTGERGGRQVSLRWIYVHMIEEYARHNGHADLLRERIDGVTGD
ncbi:DinB family protein [Streptomyces sp. NPDC018031]|uniref:DinB family protein n=1 Tax=Streptomyces sp. NPDC018031 TaxID=3365033 RepID=UPI0037A4762B